jgi:prepilin-type N-terminal cleavage/methylation domain-containing protein
MWTHAKKGKRKMLAQGFSLVELMVSLTIFAIVMTVSMGTLIVMIDANAKAQALYQAMTNISFATDSITRNLRTANTYYCSTSWSFLWPSNSATADCSGGGGKGIVFTRERDSLRTGYRLNMDSSSDNYQSIEQREGTGEWFSITSDDIKITSFDLTVVGTDDLYTDDDNVQPRIFLLISGYVDNGLDTATDFTIQTNVTQRILNY